MLQVIFYLLEGFVGCSGHFEALLEKKQLMLAHIANTLLLPRLQYSLTDVLEW